MGVHFSFYNFTGLIDLQMGIVERLNDSRREAFTILYCDFSNLDKEQIETSVEQVVRSSDAYVHNDGNYFFLLYQTDIYGAQVVAGMLEEFFATKIKHDIVAFPKNADTSQELFDALQASVKKKLDIDLMCLDHSSRKKPSN